MRQVCEDLGRSSVRPHVNSVKRFAQRVFPAQTTHAL